MRVVIAFAKSVSRFECFSPMILVKTWPIVEEGPLRTFDQTWDASQDSLSKGLVGV